jgi:hypothetical protein
MRWIFDPFSISIHDIARDLTIWMAARDFLGRPTRQVSEF